MERDPQLRLVFLAEARSHVARLRDPVATAEVRQQAAHGLRGAAATVGAELIRALAADLENEDPTPREREALLERIVEALDAWESGATPIAPVAAFGQPTQKQSTNFEDEWDPETTELLRGLFRQEADEHLDVITSRLLAAVEDPSALTEALRRAHTLKGSAGTVGYACMQRAAHQLEERLIALREGVLPLGDDLIDALLGASDLLRPLVAATTLGEAEQILERFSLLLTQLDAIVTTPRQRKETNEVPVVRSESNTPRERRREDLHVIRVDVERIDDLMNAVGQLVIDRTRVERRVEELRGLVRDLGASRRALFSALTELGQVESGRQRLGRPQEVVGAATRLGEIDSELADASANLERATSGLAEDSEAMRRTTHQLQEQLTRVRMMSIHWLFARLSRPLRELSRSEGKQVELTTAGESTELDRSVLEKITDPLIHLVRNAVAHGIETPAARQAAGKPATGVLSVSARHQGEFIYIEVEDDGAGIDPETLRSALRRWGQLEDDPADLSDEEVLDCIFISGFSTRSEVDSLAGRGVGLDVVRRNVSSLGGDLRVTSKVGRGTRFMIRLPLTTAIAQALLFREGDVVYAIPVAHVVETLVAGPSDLRQPEGKEGLTQLASRGGWIPVLWMHELLGGDDDARDARRAMIILAFGKGSFALGCRQVLEPREIVLKPLGPLLSRIPLFAGATVSGAGEVQLVLDVAALDELVQRSLRLRRRLRLPTVRHEQPPQPRVLLADDSRAIREAVAMILRGGGYLVDTAADGWEAWEQLRRRSYDALITDLEMPRLHGYELIGRCRNDSELRQLPIVVLTSRSAEKNRLQAREAGADAFLAKPVNRRVILEQVATLLRSDSAQT